MKHPSELELDCPGLYFFSFFFCCVCVCVCRVVSILLLLFFVVVLVFLLIAHLSTTTTKIKIKKTKYIPLRPLSSFSPFLPPFLPPFLLPLSLCLDCVLSFYSMPCDCRPVGERGNNNDRFCTMQKVGRSRTLVQSYKSNVGKERAA